MAEEGAKARLVDDAGRPVAPQTPLSELARGGSFGLELEEGKSQPLAVTCATDRAADALLGGSSSSLPALLETSKVLALRELLAQEQRSRITWSEFEDLCQSCSIDVLDVPRLAGDLHRAGAILHFSGEPELAGSVYLRPAEALEDLFSRYAVESPVRRLLSLELSKLQQQLEGVEGRLRPTLALQRALDAQAEKACGRGMWAISGGVVAGAGSYWYLAYIYFSWDIMEPVTFFTSLGVSAVGYAWWAGTNSDYEYGNIYDWLLFRSRRKRYARAGLDLKELAALEAQAATIRSRLEEAEGRRFRLDCMAAPGMQRRLELKKGRRCMQEV